MNLISTGKRIAERRRKLGLTQEQLAEKLNVTVQAVSKWENGHNLPDIENLYDLAKALKMPFSALFEGNDKAYELGFRDRLFHEDNMFTRVKTNAQTRGLKNTLSALEFMRKMHAGQYRKGNRYSSESVAYINHPLMMACQALAMRIYDDELLAAILLHDVVEDTGASLDELPVNSETKEIIRLVTFRKLPDKTYEESKAVYYDEIKKNKKACAVKIIDRCNNVSTMTTCFSKEKTLDYIEETETYIIPLINRLKSTEYTDAAFIVKYQIIALIESIKALL